MTDRTRSPYWAGLDGINENRLFFAEERSFASANEKFSCDKDLSGVEGEIRVIRNEPIDSASSFPMNFVRTDWPANFLLSSCCLTAWPALSLMALMMN